MLPLLASLLLLPAQTEDWQKLEAPYLKNVRQITKSFARAGEGYFSPDGKRIIFQAEEKGSGNPFYQIFVMDLASGKYRRVSPGIGKTTCAYFRPDGAKISALGEPAPGASGTLAPRSMRRRPAG